MDEEKESWIYRLFCSKSRNFSGELLYVGISDSPSSRMGNHESQKWWWWLVDRVEWTKCHNRRHAEKHETDVISCERPLFNRSESNLCAWERLRDIFQLMWAHEYNSSNVIMCPFCDSHGRQEFLTPYGELDVFRRGDDDEIVLHFVVQCTCHNKLPQWAVHILAEEFLAKNRVPQVERERLLSEAIRSGKVPWEDRYRREPTLLEKLDNTSHALWSDKNTTQALEST